MTFIRLSVLLLSLCLLWKGGWKIYDWWEQADAHSKSLKKALEQKEARVMSLVSSAVDPKPMPLFDQPAA